MAIQWDPTNWRSAVGIEGWYPVPGDPTRQRFWDGSVFTGQSRDAPGIVLPPRTDPAPYWGAYYDRKPSRANPGAPPPAASSSTPAPVLGQPLSRASQRPVSGLPAKAPPVRPDPAPASATTSPTPPARPPRQSAGTAWLLIPAAAVAALILTKMFGGDEGSASDRRPTVQTTANYPPAVMTTVATPKQVAPARVPVQRTQDYSTRPLPTFATITFPTPPTFTIPTAPLATHPMPTLWAPAPGGVPVVCGDGSISGSGGKQGACSHHRGKR